MAIVTVVSVPAIALGVWQSKKALLSQSVATDLQTVLSLWERLDHHWCRFLASNTEASKAFEFGQLAGYYELACGLFRDRVLTTKAARTLKEHLQEILPRMKENKDFAARFESLSSEPSTFANIEWFCGRVSG